MNAKKAFAFLVVMLCPLSVFAMHCPAEVRYYINRGVYRDRDSVNPLSENQSIHERVNNDNIKLGDDGWRTYSAILTSNCGEFAPIERVMSFRVKK